MIPAARWLPKNFLLGATTISNNTGSTSNSAPTLAKEIRLRDLSAEARRAKAEARAKTDGIIGKFVILNEAPRGRSEESLPKENSRRG